MGYKDITAGKKQARYIAARVIESEKGTKAFEFCFEFKEGDAVERLNWQGWLSEAAMPHTIKTMYEVLGYNDTFEVEIDPVTKLFKEGVFDRNKDIELVVELETYEGKVRPKVRWVNAPGGGSAFKSLAPESVRGQLEAIGFRAACLSYKSGRGPVKAPIEKARETAKDPFAASAIPEDQIPF